MWVMNNVERDEIEMMVPYYISEQECEEILSTPRETKE